MSSLATMLQTPGAMVQCDDDPEAVYEFLCEKGWSDGLPVIPPTPERVERILDPAHDREGVAVLAREVGALAEADAVLAGAGAAHRLRPLYQPMHEVLAARHLVGVIDVAQQRAVKIAVADMADDRRYQIETF